MGSVPTSDEDYSHLQDVLGSIPMVKLYIILCLFFPLDPSVPISDVESSIRDALGRVAKAFPYLTGQVVYKDRDEATNRSGVPLIVPLAPTIELIVKDLRHDSSISSFAELEAARFPFSMLDTAVLVPAIAVSWSSAGYDVNAPVLILQANFVHGGLILTVNGNHTQMDMTGMGNIISFFAKACRNDPFTEKEIMLGNQPRGNIVPLLDDLYQPGMDIDDLMAKPRAPDASNQLASNPRWVYFRHSAANLKRLKLEASKQDMVPYISTDDAISALWWQRLRAARSLRSDPASGSMSTFARPLSMRKYLNLELYTGHLVDVAYDSVESVHTLSIGTIAARLRQMLMREEELIQHVRAHATILKRSGDKTRIQSGANINPDRDLVFSSWGNIRSCELDYGPILRRPLAARTPKMSPWPTLFFLMPKDLDESMAVACCIDEKDLELLRKDEVLMSYSEFLG